MTSRSPYVSQRKKLTPKQRVQRRYHCAGASLSAMHGWQIMDYYSQLNPTKLASSHRSEAAAWSAAARRMK